MRTGNITLKGKGTVRVWLSNGREAIIKASFYAENMQYRSWWEDPIGEGMGSLHYEDFEFPNLDEIQIEEGEYIYYEDGKRLEADVEVEKITEEIDIEWEADEDTFSEDEPDYDYHYDRIKEEVA